MRRLICLAILGLSIASMPAAAKTTVPYDLASTPVANRDKIVDVGDVRIYTAPNGWYALTLKPGDVPAFDGARKSVLRGREEGNEHEVLMTFAIHQPKDWDAAASMGEAQERIPSLTTPPPSFRDLSDIDYRLVDLGGGGGKQSVLMTLWYADGTKLGYPTQGMGFIPVPKGTIIVLLLTHDKAEAEAMLIESLRVGEGILE